MKEEKILVTGGSGMVGYALRWGYVHGNSIPNAIFVSSDDYDLRNWNQVEKMFEYYQPEYVIHLAAKVGGIKANMNNLGAFYRDNILINTNILEAARLYKIQKIVSLLSTCIYPQEVTYPLTEEQIHDGPPHPSNYAYAYAKRMLDVQSRAYREQYGCNFITAVSNNLFGENDNFDLEDSHVIPAMIRKMYNAKLEKKDVILWGDGSPLREFTYSGDMAEILLFLMENYDSNLPINIGNTKEVQIKEAAEIIAELLNYEGKIIWDTSKPKGQYRKPSLNKKFIDLGWKEEYYTDLRLGLDKTIKWFLRNYPNLRGV
jgi:GDP-L-fucose synthase